MRIEILLGNNVRRYVRESYLSDADVCVGIRAEGTNGDDLYFFGWNSPTGELFIVNHLDSMTKRAIENGDFSFEALLDENWLEKEFYYERDRGITMTALICRMINEYRHLMKSKMTKEELADLDKRLDGFTDTVVFCFNSRTMSQSYNEYPMYSENEKKVSRGIQDALRDTLNGWMARISFHTPYAYSGQLLIGNWRSLELVTYKNHIAIKKADCLKAKWLSGTPLTSAVA